MDFDSSRLLCPFCQVCLLTADVFTNSSVDHLALLVPKGHRDAFLAKLGFQRQPVRRTPKPLVWLLTVLFFVGALPCILLQEWHRIAKAIAFLFVALFVFSLWKLYKEEETPKWRRAKPDKKLSSDAAKRKR